MGLIFLIVAGSIIGWLAAIVRSEEDKTKLFVDAGAGVAGALFGGLVLAPAFGLGNLLSGTYHVPALLCGIAIAFIAVGAATVLGRHRELN